MIIILIEKTNNLYSFSNNLLVHLSGKSAITFSGDINQNILKNTAIPADLILSNIFD